MSKKTLMVLAALVVALLAALWKSGKTDSSPAVKSEGEGQALLPGVELSTLSMMEIQEGSSTTHLEIVDGIWCVAEQENAPADFNRLRGLIRSMDEMKRGQVAETGDSHLAEYGLADGGDGSTVRITLKHAKGTTILRLGKMRESQRREGYWVPPGGRYARVDDGPILLLKEDMRMAQASAEVWWDRTLLEVAPESIRNVSVQTGEESFVLELGTNGVISLVGAGDGERVNGEAAHRLFGAVRSLRADKILPIAKEVGLAFSKTTSFQAETEGATYRIQLGDSVPELGEGRPIRMAVEVSSGATPEQQAAAVAVAKKINGRTFMIPAYLADSLSPKRDSLLQRPESVPETAPEMPPVPVVE